MSILITGAGAVGALAAKKLVDMGERPVLFEIAPNLDNIASHVSLDKIKLIRGDILELPEILLAIKNEGVDRIIHTATLLTMVMRERPYTGIRTNLLGTVNILEAARLMNVKRVVFCSSQVVQMGTYDRLSKVPYVEDFPLNAISGRPRDAYAILKLTCEWLGLDYMERYGVDFAAVRFAGIYGPGKGMPNGVLTKTMKELIEKPLLGQPARIDNPVLLWSGCEDLIHAKDAANSTILAAYATNPANRIYNVSMGRAFTFDEVVGIIRKSFPGAEVTVPEVKTGSGGYPFHREQPSDISKARVELGYEPEFDTIEKAIEDYRTWMKANGVI